LRRRFIHGICNDFAAQSFRRRDPPECIDLVRKLAVRACHLSSGGERVLYGPAVMNGSGRGTAVVALFVAVPILLISIVAAARGAVRPVISTLGATAYLVYNAVLFLFITPINQLFVFYVAMFALCFWTLVSVLRSMDVPTFARHFSVRFPARAMALVLAIIAVLNAMAWLVRIVPAIFDDNMASLVAGTGVATNPIYVQDLAFWIPLMAVAAVWTWKGRPWGLVVTGAIFVFGFIESVSIAVDQWMGSAADTSSSVASATLTPAFVIVALVRCVPAFFYFRNLNRD
jgi:hypothetical protein